MASSHALSKDAVLQLHAQLRMLLDAELFESALDLAQVVISASERQPAMPAVGMGSTADACIMAGDASRGNGENARAAVRRDSAASDALTTAHTADRAPARPTTSAQYRASSRMGRG